jgi:protein-tyrosine-phosphatase/DNA-binding transcriptional ArsR family regulator
VAGGRGRDSGPDWLDEGLLGRARRHAALGEPVRLAMVERLLLTDAAPGELGTLFGLATNVLAHHLKVLQAAGLVRRVRSEGDARRAYVQLCLNDPQVASLLSQGSSARPAVAGLPGQAGAGRPGRVLFVCTANSARSQLAAAAWARVSPLPVASAGTHPAARVHPRAVATGRRHGLRIDPRATAGLEQAIAAGDLVVCVCDNAHEELVTAGPDALGVPVAGSIHWAVADPVPVDTDEAFEHAYAEITGRVQRLADALQPVVADQPA